MMRRLFALFLILVTSVSPLGAQAPVLAVQGDHFTLDGAPKFLLFISYFDAMRRLNDGSGSDEEIDGDLDYFKDQGFDGIRIFPNWWQYGCGGNVRASDTLFTGGATLRSGKLALLKRVLDRAAHYGLLVDVSFSRETVPDLGHDDPSAQDIDDYKEQIRLVAEALDGAYPHVLFDLANEYDGNDLDDPDIVEIATAIRAEDPQRILLASTGASGATAQYDAGDIVADANLDVAGVHPPRSPSSTWYTDTVIEKAIDDARDGMNDGGIASPYRPVYLQEPMPFSDFDGPGCAQTNDDNRDHHADAVGFAKANGAAAYTFHTRLTFNLATQTYLSKLGSAASEQNALEAIYPAALSEPWGATLPFTDSSIVVGSTLVKKVHVEELRQRVNAQRLRFNQSPYSWTDPSPIVGVTQVKAAHISELRTALAAAYQAHGLSAPTYTDPTLTVATTPVKAVHINQLRSALVYLEQH
jgi:hypothetical protein